MSLETPRDLFIHELSDCMSAEHIILKVLNEMSEETGNADLNLAIASPGGGGAGGTGTTVAAPNLSPLTSHLSLLTARS